jgi:hypothetical protein
VGIDPITWEAAATLIAGILAVSAATVVALKQGSIVKRQALLQELALRHDLFDKRMAIFRTVRHYVARMIHASSSKDDIADEMVEFGDAVEEARFLLSKKLFLELSSIEHAAQEILRSIYHMEHNDRDLDTVDHCIKDIERRKHQLRARYNALPAMFEREMNIRTADQGLDDYVDEFQLPDPVDDIDTVTRTAKKRMAEWQSEGRIV